MMSSIDPTAENLRAHFAFASQQMCSLEERHLQVFLLSVTASAAIIAIPADPLRDAIPWIAIAVLNALSFFLMLRLHLWVNRYWSVLREVYRSWALPTQLDIFGPAKGERIPLATRRAMQLVAFVLTVLCALLAFNPVRAGVAASLS